MDILLVLFAPLCNSWHPSSQQATLPQLQAALLSSLAKSMQPCAGKYHHIYSLSDLMSLSLKCCWMISCLVQEGSSSGNIKVPESCSLQSLILFELLARFLSPSQLTSLLEPVS